MSAGPSERTAIRLELERARRSFHGLVSNADDEDFGRPSNGTRWTNRQLLFHMMFGYLIVRAPGPVDGPSHAVGPVSSNKR